MENTKTIRGTLHSLQSLKCLISNLNNFIQRSLDAYYLPTAHEKLFADKKLHTEGLKNVLVLLVVQTFYEAVKTLESWRVTICLLSL